MRWQSKHEARLPSLLYDRVTRNAEIDALIRNGLLAAENSHDYDSVQSALYAFLDRALGELGDA